MKSIALARSAAAALFVAIAASAMLAAAPQAQAGTYPVYACFGGGGNASWTPINSGPHTSPVNSCPGGGDQASSYTGIGGRTTDGASSWTNPNQGSWSQFDAPAGTSLSSMQFSYSMDSHAYSGCPSQGCDGNPWWVGIGAWNDGGAYAWPLYYLGGPFPHDTPPVWHGGGSVDLSGLTHVFAGIICWPAYNSSYGCWADWQGGHGAYANINNVVVNLNDYTSPSIQPTAGNLWNGGWHRGYEDAWGWFTGGVGIRATSMSVDGAVVNDQEYWDQWWAWPANVRCDAGYTVPCHNVNAGFGLDTSTLSDGPHTLAISARTPGGNPGGWQQTLYVDNHAPSAPTGIALSGSQGWRSTNSFDLSWSNPDQGPGSPIAAADYKLCDANGSCTTGSQGGSNISSLSGVKVPNNAAGDYTLRIYLQDAAGNVNAAALSDPVHLRFDPQPPGQAQPQQRNGWLNANEIAQNPEAISLKAGEFRPLSGVAGYAVAVNADPGTAINATGDPGTFSIANLPEGVNHVRARAISGAGVPSTQIGDTVVEVDKSPPTSSASAAPDPDVWYRGPVSFGISGADALSGMAPSTDGNVFDGAYMTSSTDGGTAQRTPGPSGTVSVASDGVHSVTYMATDRAGNDSAQKQLTVRVDQTPPDVASFELMDPSDPTLLSMLTRDQMSGVAGGQLEMAPHGTDAWTSLPTVLIEGHLIARIPDDQVRAGTYDFRGHVRDFAGNERVGEHFLNGEAAILHLPVRLASRIVSQRSVRLVCSSSRKSPKRGARRGRKGAHGKKATADAAKTAKHNKHQKKIKPVIRCKAQPTDHPAPLATKAFKLKYGERKRIDGALQTGQGVAIPRGVIDVLEQLATGGSYQRVATIRVDTNGFFSYTIPAGASRTVGFYFAGTPTILRTRADVWTQVPAAALLDVGPKITRNHKSVMFTGRLRGGPFPEHGKLVQLQAFDRGKWRTFQLVRTDKRGLFSYRYQFTQTSRSVTYHFRVAVPLEAAAYPYDSGASNTVRVHVDP